MVSFLFRINLKFKIFFFFFLCFLLRGDLFLFFVFFPDRVLISLRFSCCCCDLKFDKMVGSDENNPGVGLMRPANDQGNYRSCVY